MKAEHPGEIIKRFMLAEDRTQSDLAKEIGISKAYLCDILKARRNISAEVARKLARALGMSPHYWMYQQVDYDLGTKPAKDREGV